MHHADSDMRERASIANQVNRHQTDAEVKSSFLMCLADSGPSGGISDKGLDGLLIIGLSHRRIRRKRRFKSLRRRVAIHRIQYCGLIIVVGFMAVPEWMIILSPVNDFASSVVIDCGC